MAISLVQFHGASEDNLKLNVLSQGDSDQEQQQILTQLQNQFGSERVQLITMPIRLKQSDDDFQDFNNPIPIKEGRKIFTYRKILKLQIAHVPPNFPQFTYSNLRVYVDKESIESGVELYIQVQNQFYPQSQQDSEQDVPFQGDFQTYYVLNNFEINNQFDVFRNQFWTPQYLSSTDKMRKYFGEQPYIYIQASFQGDQTKTSGITSFTLNFQVDVN